MKKILKKLLAAALASLTLVCGVYSEEPNSYAVVNNASITVKDISSNPILVKISEKTGLIDDDKIVVMTVNGEQLTLADYEMAYFNTAATALNSLLQYAQFGMKPDLSQLENEEFIESYKTMFYSNIKMPVAILAAAKDKNIAPTDEEIDTEILAFYDQVSAQYEGNLEAFTSEPLSPTMNNLIVYQYINFLYNKLAETYADNDAVTAKVNEVLEKVNAGEDFDALIAEYNEDPGMEQATDGYYFTTNEMVKPFEEAAFALEDNAVSGIVETDYGYHIIKRLPVDDEFKATTTYKEVYDNLSAEFEGEALEAELAKYVRAKHILVQFADGYTPCNEALTATLEGYEIVKVDNFDELVAPAHKEVEDVIVDLKKQLEDVFAEPSEEETAPEVSEEVVEESGDEETEEPSDETAEVTEEPANETVEETAEVTEEPANETAEETAEVTEEPVE